MKHILVGEAATRKVWLDGNLLDPARSQREYNHSPDGFSWGFGGSGPAQLALAILLEITSWKAARRKYQEFKWGLIAKLPQGQDFSVEFFWERKDEE